MCLQVEANDDSGGSCAPDISNESRGFVNDNNMPAVQQVGNFISIGFCGFRILLDVSCYIFIGAVYEIMKHMRVQQEIAAIQFHFQPAS